MTERPARRPTVPATTLVGWGRIEPVARILRMGERDPDDGFWLSKKLNERIAHIWELQRSYYGAPPASGDGEMSLGTDLYDFLSLCVRNELRFLVVGGHAVGAHGHPRLTKDLDVWIWVDPENAARMVRVLDEFGFGSAGLTQADFAAQGDIVQLGYPPNRIDILTRLSGVEFESCWERRVVGQLDDLSVPFIGYSDLERNKLAAGRDQDRADVAALRRQRAARRARRGRGTTGARGQDL